MMQATKVLILVGFLAGFAASVPTCSQISTMRDAVVAQLRNTTGLLPLLVRLG